MPDNVGVNRQQNRQQERIGVKRGFLSARSILHRIFYSDVVDGYRDQAYFDLRSNREDVFFRCLTSLE